MFSLLCRIRDFLRDFRSRCRKLLHRACLLGRTLRQRLCPAGHLIGACVDLAGCCAHLRHGFFHRIGDAVQRLLDLYKVAAIKRRGLGGEIFVRDFTQYIGNIRNDPFQTGLRMRKDLFQIADLVVGLAFDVRTQIALGKFLSHLTDQSQGSDQGTGSEQTNKRGNDDAQQEPDCQNDKDHRDLPHVLAAGHTSQNRPVVPLNKTGAAIIGLAIALVLDHLAASVVFQRLLYIV